MTQAGKKLTTKAIYAFVVAIIISPLCAWMGWMIAAFIFGCIATVALILLAAIGWAEVMFRTGH